MALIKRYIGHTDIAVKWRLGYYGNYEITGSGRVSKPYKITGSGCVPKPHETYFINGIVEETPFYWQLSIDAMQNELTSTLIPLLDKLLRKELEETDAGIKFAAFTPDIEWHDEWGQFLQEMDLGGGLRSVIQDDRPRFFKDDKDVTDELANILNVGLYLEVLRCLHAIKTANSVT